jgi:hypothetical protein
MTENTPAPEQWLPVPGFEGAYEVSNLGRVRSLPRMVRAGANGGFRAVGGNILKPVVNVAGYTQVRLPDGKTRTIHSLVAQAFLGERPAGYQVCHNNGDPSDNRVENLRIDTVSSNMQDIVKHGRHSNAQKTQCSRGHEYTPENTARRSDGSGGARRCLTCQRERSARRLREKHEREKQSA